MVGSSVWQNLSGRDKTERQCVRALSSMPTRLDFMPYAMELTEILELIRSVLRMMI